MYPPSSSSGREHGSGYTTVTLAVFRRRVEGHGSSSTRACTSASRRRRGSCSSPSFTSSTTPPIPDRRGCGTTHDAVPASFGLRSSACRSTAWRAGSSRPARPTGCTSGRLRVAAVARGAASASCERPTRERRRGARALPDRPRAGPASASSARICSRIRSRARDPASRARARPGPGESVIVTGSPTAAVAHGPAHACPRRRSRCLARDQIDRRSCSCGRPARPWYTPTATTSSPAPLRSRCFAHGLLVDARARPSRGSTSLSRSPPPPPSSPRSARPAPPARTRRRRAVTASPSHRTCAPVSSTATARVPTCTSRRASAVTSPARRAPQVHDRHRGGRQRREHHRPRQGPSQARRPAGPRLSCAPRDHAPAKPRSAPRLPALRSSGFISVLTLPDSKVGQALAHVLARPEHARLRRGLRDRQGLTDLAHREAVHVGQQERRAHVVAQLGGGARDGVAQILARALGLGRVERGQGRRVVQATGAAASCGARRAPGASRSSAATSRPRRPVGIEAGSARKARRNVSCARSSTCGPLPSMRDSSAKTGRS